jgi:hypothetical protein
MKIILAITSVLFFCTNTLAVNLTYDLVSCTQACGLTPNTSDYVSILAVNGYDFQAALNLQCQWRGMKLQKEIACTSTRYDYSKSEGAVRCNQGINTSPRFCRATVYGYGQSASRRGVTQVHGDQSAANFTSAIKLAMDDCRNKFAAQGISTYRCYLSWYASNGAR